MTDDVFWTIVFGLVQAVIGIYTSWQNFQLVRSSSEGEKHAPSPKPRLIVKKFFATDTSVDGGTDGDKLSIVQVC